MRQKAVIKVPAGPLKIALEYTRLFWDIVIYAVKRLLKMPYMVMAIQKPLQI